MIQTTKTISAAIPGEFRKKKVETRIAVGPSAPPMIPTLAALLALLHLDSEISAAILRWQRFHLLKALYSLQNNPGGDYFETRKKGDDLGPGTAGKSHRI